MNRLAVLILVGMGAACGEIDDTGDDLGAPRLVRRASNLVPVVKMGFDAENRPLGLLDTDHRQRLSRLTPRGWEVLESADTLNVQDIGSDADGSLLFTVGNLPPGSGVFQLAPNDKLVQIGNRIATAQASEPFQSPWGDLFVSTVDGGRRLNHGTSNWVIAKALSQVARTRDAVYGMSGAGLERLDIDDREGVGTLLLPCSRLPLPCAEITFDGRDASGRLYFHVDGAPELWVLDAGATELRPLTIDGVHALGSVLATDRFVVVEAIAMDDDVPHSYLYLLPAGGSRFTLVDLRARMNLSRPVLAVDHMDTVFVAHTDWLGTIELR